MNYDENENIQILKKIINVSETVSIELSNIMVKNSELSIIQDDIEKKLIQLSKIINPIEPLKANNNKILNILDNIKRNNSTINIKTIEILKNEEHLNKIRVSAHLNLNKISVHLVQISNILNSLLKEYNDKLSELESTIIQKNIDKNFIYINNNDDFFYRNKRQKTQLYDFTIQLDDEVQFMLNFIEEISLKREKNKDENYLNKIKSDSDLIIKKLENEVENLIEEFNNRYKEIQLDQEKSKNSTNLLIQGVDSGLKKLNDLNNRTQKIELEYSTIIGSESEKIKTDLNSSKTALLEIVDSIEHEANTKLININNAHTNFINLVQNAGIYELTQNYKAKADEEKGDYKLNMWLTVTAIVFAIIATIVVIAIPIIEHWKANPAVDMDYFTLFARFSISIMFFVLALYTSKQAAKHYECYQENHRTFLQLAALEPFMSSMSPDEQKEIRKGLIPSYFNQASEGKYASKSDEVGLPESFKSSIDKLADVVKEITVSQKSTKPSENE